MKARTKDILIRAGKTFAQAFVASLSVDYFFGVTDVQAIKRIGLSMLVSAIAAGVSAVWNIIIEAVNTRIEKIGAPEPKEDE